MSHTLFDSLRADCRLSAGRARWPAHPGYRQNRPQNAPQENGQDSKALLSQPSFHSHARSHCLSSEGRFCIGSRHLEKRRRFPGFGGKANITVRTSEIFRPPRTRMAPSCDQSPKSPALSSVRFLLSIRQSRFPTIPCREPPARPCQHPP